MSKLFNYLIKPIAFKLEPEKAHNLAIAALSNNIIAKLIPKFNYTDDKLSQTIAGLTFLNPVGLAAGFDKNAETLKSIYKFGFGFAEFGSVTPIAQLGNPLPRIFRLTADEAIINRLGFNNKGADYCEENLKKFGDSKQIIGVNIGKNKDQEDFLSDYLFLLNKFYNYASYIAVNISSPNTPGLRDLQHNENLEILLGQLMELKNKLKIKFNKSVPLFIKISPDNDFKQLEAIAAKVLKHQIDGVIISNTTINDREKLLSSHKNQMGGLSGKPLFNRANTTLARFYKLTQGIIPLIGVGGIMNGDDAYQKILYGASLIQIYTGIIYKGFGLINRINQQISDNLTRDGFKDISEAVGKKAT
ncbi:quinone-dependent dihydroorotate dehydrogenase [Rickettsiales endosymbiont of Stachyamoeba lipophora]|uniref:quinone-dependent dihydroorotate dehydrogenase n=1 Tax=Rickettsiales endosymbiont of Stachyamoeba lipophora TaxID=2486578 RepID=UPI000F64C56C|nr:quinone-dependent dihydroorotate dehydrogenase [Rickettsiales endosymbiont of Stachyamoeba lipophora]AZL16291.1 quinone-dependent dihydroorotate dehydrogenase [Rickettsiales endosymbiont of Stachyamoeba lipophora]